MLREVLFRKQPSWVVGEHTEERDERMRSGVPARPSECWPGNYGGRVTSSRSVDDVKSGKLPSLRNMADKDHPVVVLDLDDDGVAAIASHKWKIVDGRPEPVTFDDRFGAVAFKLRERHADPEAWERDESTARKVAEAASAETMRVHDRAVKEWQVRREDFAVDLIASNRDPDVEPPAFPERPEPPTSVTIPESSFERAVADLSAALAPTVTHTGTGLYAAKVTPTHNDDTQSGAPAGQVVTLVTGGLGTSDAFKGGYVTNATRSEIRAIVSHTDGTVTLEGDLTGWLDTDDLDIYDAWSTIQAAHDQLLTDQGTAAFTALQEIRLYDGTFTESVSINHTMEPRPHFRLAFTAAPAMAPVWSCNGLANVMTMSGALSFVSITGIRFTGTATGGGAINTYFASASWKWTGCTFDIVTTGANTSLFGLNYGQTLFTDCVLDGTDSTRRVFPNTDANNADFVNCDIKNWASVVPNGTSGGSSMTGCAVSSCDVVFFARQTGKLALRNNTFYDIGIVVYLHDIDATPAELTITNNIFAVIGTAVLQEAQSAQDVLSGNVVIGGNCYHNVTKWLDSVTDPDVSTFADWQALGYDADGIEGDPLLTDPANGDFSLATGSPCIRAASPVGVIEDVNGDPFATDRTDMGAVSSGTSSTAPAISKATASPSAATVTVTAAGAPNVRVRLSNKAGAEEAEEQRLGAGAIALTPTTSGHHYVVAWGCDATGNPIGEPSAPVLVAVPATITSDGPTRSLSNRSQVARAFTEALAKVRNEAYQVHRGPVTWVAFDFNVHKLGAAVIIAESPLHDSGEATIVLELFSAWHERPIERNAPLDDLTLDDLYEDARLVVMEVVKATREDGERVLAGAKMQQATVQETYVQGIIMGIVVTIPVGF